MPHTDNPPFSPLPSPAQLRVRLAHQADAAELLAINQASTPGVGSSTLAELEAILAMGWSAFIAQDAPPDSTEEGQPGGPILGFLAALRPGCAYDSPNYQWFERRGGDYLYIDRIAVAAEARGRRVGEALYRALIKAAAPDWPLCCEVNSIPPNPGSLRFHARLGFKEIGRAAHQAGVKEVIYMERPRAISNSLF